MASWEDRGVAEYAEKRCVEGIDLTRCGMGRFLGDLRDSVVLSLVRGPQRKPDDERERSTDVLTPAFVSK